MATLAMLGGQPIRRKPFARWPVFDAAEQQALLEVLHSGVWGGYSPKVAELERRFAAFHEARFGIAMANGTLSLEAALAAAGVGAGDEVIVPPITFIATASAVLRAGAVPVFADIDAATFCLSPQRLAEAITPRTRAVIPVHFAGHVADLDAILETAAQRRLTVIEDAAHAHGGSWRGRKVGGIGHFGSFSFQQSKNMTSGEGGMLLTNDAELAEGARSVCNQGRRTGGAWYEHVRLGSNYRLTGWQAAVLGAQFDRLPAQLEKRARNAERLTALLRGSAVLDPPAVDPRVTAHGFHLYVLRMKAGAIPGLTVDLFLQALAAEGIPGAGRYPQPIYANRMFADCPYRRGECPEAERFCRECFWVSQEILLAEEADLEDFVRAVEKIRGAAGELILAAVARSDS
ncbi:MAG TPA: DegT/DnrJ/EryC1/StrS family aminotransferase [Verrucomicrobiae bacterium]|nr:DegT/DnrJ/EryC1/StrS family aminotransferase [Verrucomicrobiae bacterium]